MDKSSAQTVVNFQRKTLARAVKTQRSRPMDFVKVSQLIADHRTQYSKQRMFEKKK